MVGREVVGDCVGDRLGDAVGDTLGEEVDGDTLGEEVDGDTLGAALGELLGGQANWKETVGATLMIVQIPVPSLAMPMLSSGGP
jgi:hypothetical protein